MATLPASTPRSQSEVRILRSLAWTERHERYAGLRLEQPCLADDVVALIGPDELFMGLNDLWANPIPGSGDPIPLPGPPPRAKRQSLITDFFAPGGPPARPKKNARHC